MTSIRQLTRASAVALVALAVAAPAAQAMPAPRSADTAAPAVRAPYPYAGQEFRHPAQTVVGPIARYRALIAGSPAVTPVAVPVVAPAPSSGSNGFNWTDAAVGAVVGAGALALIGLVGVRVRPRSFAH